MSALCENCWYNEYDEESDSSMCCLILDEDEYVRLLNDRGKTCRYFRPGGDDYSIVKKQN